MRQSARTAQGSKTIAPIQASSLKSPACRIIAGRPVYTAHHPLRASPGAEDRTIVELTAPHGHFAQLRSHWAFIGFLMH
jgi:hypothetical protein